MFNLVVQPCPLFMPHSFESDPKPFEVLETKYLFQRPPWLTVREERLRLSTGGVIEQFYVFEYPAWVNVVALTRANEVVLIRQYRHAVGRVDYELPAGGCEEGETLLEAAKRELLEETGFGGGEWSSLMTLCANPATQNNFTHTFLARGVEKINVQQLEKTEEITVHLTPLSDVKRLIVEGEFIQALHIAPLLKVMLFEEGSR
jgi:8-oxo-dGTP pyrophosphatase MutT (NUDIX family)